MTDRVIGLIVARPPMPRLTDHAYLQIRQELHMAWHSDPTSVFLLDALEQWALHDYYRFAENLTEPRLLEHRKEISSREPSLPQRAGRALSRWRHLTVGLEGYRERARATSSRKKGRDYDVRTFAAVHPEIDPNRLARALLAAFADHEEAAKKRSARGDR